MLRLRALEAEGKLGFPVIAVGAAQTKRFFDDRYGTGQSTLDGILRATNTLLAGRVVVVFGYGWTGRGIALRARGAGSQVIVCEVDPLRALEAKLDGFEVAPALAAAARATSSSPPPATATSCGASTTSGCATARCSATPATSTSS